MRIGIAVMCFDRPHYLDKVINSFEEAKIKNYYDFYFFQDGGVNLYSGNVYASPNYLNLVSERIERCNLNYTHIKSEENLSPAKQRYLIYKKLFEIHDLIFVFDDDMVVGKDYFILLERLAKQFPEYYGLLYCNNNIRVKGNLRKVKIESSARLWGHYMWKHNWLKIEPRHSYYFDMIEKRDWWVMRKVRDFKLTKEFPAIGDDKVINKLLRQKGINKLVPFISRAKYIGKYGSVAYKLEEFWKKKGMDNQREQITFSEDKDIKEFILK